MTYTATGFSNPVRVIFDAVFNPTEVENERETIHEHFRSAIRRKREDVFFADRVLTVPATRATLSLASFFRTNASRAAPGVRWLRPCNADRSACCRHARVSGHRAPGSKPLFSSLPLAEKGLRLPRARLSTAAQPSVRRVEDIDWDVMRFTTV